MSQPPKPRPGGRTARVRRAVLDAAAELLTETTPDRVTVQLVADRSGVHETTIYRRWGTRDALLTEVLLEVSAQRLTVPDTGSLRADLVAVIGAVADFLRTPQGYALALLGASADDATTAALREAFWADRFERARAIFERAVSRGELTGLDGTDLAYEAMIATLHFRLLARRLPLEAGLAERLVDALLDGLPRARIT